METTPAVETPVPTETVAPAETETVTALPTPEDYAKLQAALKDANKEAATRRKKLEAFEKAEADRKTAEMSDLEKAQAKITQYENELMNTRKEAIAARHGLPASWVKRLQGATVDELEADAAELAAAMPAAKQSAPSISATAPTTQAALTPDAIRKMSHEQINANWERIQQTLANQK